MNKKELMAIREYLQENEEMVIDKIVEMMVEAESNSSGYRMELHIDNDLDVYQSGQYSQNSFSGNVWEGKAYVIATFDSWHVGSGSYDYNFDENIKNEPEYAEIKETFENQEDEFSFYDFVKDNYVEVVERMDADWRDYIISEFPEQASQKFEDAVEDLDRAISLHDEE